VPRRFEALIVSFGLTFLVAASAAAQDDVVYLPGRVVETQLPADYGNARPPSGFLKLCNKSPETCAKISSAAVEPRFTHAQWVLVDRINREVNSRIASVSDQDLYGQEELWAYPSTAGDCEDYVLLKRRELLGLGFDASQLLITVVLDEHGEGHAVLTVSTASGDYILDNRRDEILHWSRVNYTFLKRQTATDPLTWVALAPHKTHSPLVASGDNAP
jgi:predicted transglutaminase-like cysteine proteinase